MTSQLARPAAVAPGPGEPAPPGRRPRRRRLGTATRLAALLAVVLAAVLGLAVAGLLRAFSAQSSASTTRTLVAEMSAFAQAAGGRPATESLRRFTEGYLRARVLPDGEVIAVTLPDHSLVGSAGSDPLLATPLVRQWAQDPPPAGTRADLTLDHRRTRVVASPLTVRGRPVGTVVVAGDLSGAESDLARVRRLAVGEAVLALLAGTLGGYLLLRRLLRRIGRITATAADLGRGELDRRLGDQGTDDEVGRLAQTFDAMADRVSTAMTSQRRLLSDVSHQLRTPLTVAQGHLEVLQLTGVTDPAEVRSTVDLVVDELGHMRALVERLLMLGRAMEPDFLDVQPVDLRSFTADLVEAARVLASRRWLLGPVPDVVVAVDEAKLRGAMLNLLDNAVRATGADDVVAVSARLDPDGAVTLLVDDGGPGIDPARRPSVLQRFARPGAADSEGSGLGLAIVTTVAAAHGGDVALLDSPYGGLRVALRLPPAARVGPDGG